MYFILLAITQLSRVQITCKTSVQIKNNNKLPDDSSVTLRSDPVQCTNALKQITSYVYLLAKSTVYNIKMIFSYLCNLDAITAVVNESALW